MSLDVNIITQTLVAGLLLSLIIGIITTIIILWQAYPVQQEINKSTEKNMEQTNKNQEKQTELLNDLHNRVSILENEKNKEG